LSARAAKQGFARSDKVLARGASMTPVHLANGPARAGMLSLAFALGLAAAQTRAADSASPADTAFLQKAAAVNAAEIKISQTAQTRAQSSVVKAFADRMVDEHSANEHALEALARKKDIAVTAEPDADHLMRIGTLQNLENGAFDRAYAKLMIEDHRAAVRLLESGARDAQDPDIRKFAEATLPVVREHAQAAAALPR
jgi:putative membrane protein